MSHASQHHSQDPSRVGAAVKAQSGHSEHSSDAASQGSCASRPGSPQPAGPQPEDHASIMRNAAAELNMDEDQFYMYIYKVAPCMKNYTHNWSACPFAHKGEKATRRDPLKYSYMASNCPDHKRGMCPRGDSCNFAHGVFESCLHPERYRTQMCNSTTTCTRSVCFFAHTEAELRSPYCRNSPSQMDSTTATALRAMLGRDSQPSQAPMRPQPPAHNMMMQNRMPQQMGMRHQNFPGNQMPQQGTPQAGDILNQACNLLATIQMLAQQQQQQPPHQMHQQQAGHNDLLLAQQNLIKTLQASGGLSSQACGSNLGGLGNNSLLSGLHSHGSQSGMEWHENNLSMLLNSSGGQADLGLGDMRQPCSLSNNNEFGFTGGYNLPQQPFSYHLAS